MKIDNDLIAEFMGVDTHNGWNPHQPNIPKYNYDWNLLMPVVEKIESTGHAFEIVQENATVFDHDSKNNLNEIIPICGESKIQATYQAVVEFIKWYKITTGSNMKTEKDKKTGAYSFVSEAKEWLKENKREDCITFCKADGTLVYASEDMQAYADQQVKAEGIKAIGEFVFGFEEDRLYSGREIHNAYKKIKQP